MKFYYRETFLPAKFLFSEKIDKACEGSYDHRGTNCIGVVEVHLVVTVGVAVASSPGHYSGVVRVLLGTLKWCGASSP